mmetsp:Transcript_24865/g.41168  ORF Transcript_24865/g.41168 Transcript_24865/m.41168 type:complete len:492 (+) Transcript_24865:56-1531(+)
MLDFITDSCSIISSSLIIFGANGRILKVFCRLRNLLVRVLHFLGLPEGSFVRRINRRIHRGRLLLLGTGRNLGSSADSMLWCVCFHRQENVQVARRSTAGTHVPFAAHKQHFVVLRSRRDGDLDMLGILAHTLSMAGSTALLVHVALSCSLTGGAGLLRLEIATGGASDLVGNAGSIARRAGRGFGARHATVTRAGATRFEVRNGHHDLSTAAGRGGIELQLKAHIGTNHGTSSGRRTRCRACPSNITALEDIGGVGLSKPSDIGDLLSETFGITKGRRIIERISNLRSGMFTTPTIDVFTTATKDIIFFKPGKASKASTTKAALAALATAKSAAKDIVFVKASTSKRTLTARRVALTTTTKDIIHDLVSINTIAASASASGVAASNGGTRVVLRVGTHVCLVVRAILRVIRLVDAGCFRLHLDFIRCRRCANTIFPKGVVVSFEIGVLQYFVGTIDILKGFDDKVIVRIVIRIRMVLFCFGVVRFLDFVG